MRRRAFTLVELLVATICLSITAFGILSAISFSDNQNALSRQRMLALSCATSAMETCRSKAYSSALVAGVFTTELESSNLPQPADQVVTVSSTADPLVFDVNVRVTWTVMTAAGPTQRSIHLDTVLRNNDVP